ncbi:MAG: sulfurtransferase [Blastocatellia bacterium]
MNRDNINGMIYTTVISKEDSIKHLDDRNWAFVDCRFVLREPEQGFDDYLKSHIRGAVYANLDHDLSGPVIKGKTGRHPLPDPGKLVATLSSWGIDAGTQVVAYDESSGAMAAARLWWLLKWAGHDTVAVLDGGFKQWVDAGYPKSGGLQKREPGKFEPHFHQEMVAGADDLGKVVDDPSYVIIDARSADRYRGENESIDPVAGHIRGAISGPFADNQNEQGLFKSPEELKAQFERATGGVDAERTIFYCGSGVTAAHSVLAYVRSGNAIPRLYAGSWSDWITDPSRPIVTGQSRR